MNKGFTLVELIAVISIMGILIVITMPSYGTISNNMKQTNYNSKKETIRAQTLSYVERYLKDFTHSVDDYGTVNNEVLCFKATSLIQNGIISSDSEKEDYIENDVTKYHYDAEDARNYGAYIKVFYDPDNLKIDATIRDEDEFGNHFCGETY